MCVENHATHHTVPAETKTVTQYDLIFFPQCDAAAKVNTTTVFALVDIDRLLAVLDLLVAGTKEDCKYYRTLVGRAVRKLLACVTKDSMVAVPHKSLEGSE